VASEVNSFVKLSRLVPRNICNPLFFLYLINKVNAFMYVTQFIIYQKKEILQLMGLNHIQKFLKTLKLLTRLKIKED